MEIAHARAAEMKSNENSATKRRKLDAGEVVVSSSSSLENLNQCSCLIDSPENSTSPATNSLSSDQTPVNHCSTDEFCNSSSRSADLKKVENSKATLMNSRELTPDVMETTTKKKTKKKKASSPHQPSMAEIEEFFTVAEKYEAKRFAEKYNYDIGKDVPLQGKYQWVRIEQ